MKLVKVYNLKLTDDSLTPIIIYLAQVYFKLNNHYNKI